MSENQNLPVQRNEPNESNESNEPAEVVVDPVTTQDPTTTPQGPEVHHPETYDEFKELLSTTDKKYAIVDCFADWCGPCRFFAPTFEQLSAEYPDVLFVKVNVDDLEEVGEDFGVSALPTFLRFECSDLSSGNKYPQIVGASKDKVVQGLNSLTEVKLSDNF